MWDLNIEKMEIKKIQCKNLKKCKECDNVNA